MIWTKDLKFQNSSLDIKTTIKIKANRIKQINGNLYIYVFSESIQVYDCKTFKLKANLKLPFIRKEPILDILDNEVLIYMAAEKLYFYKINLAENKLVFMHYLSNICNFLFLPKRKEIFLLTESYCEDKNKPYGMAKSDLMGNIILTNKITPKINHEFVEPEKIDNDFPTHVVSNTKNFSVFYGLCDEKYIINICGYFDDWYDYKIRWGQTEVSSSIDIYKVDDLKEILDERHQNYLDYLKIGDNLFKFKEKDIFFFYNEKENKIEYINNLPNYLNNTIDDKLIKNSEEVFHEGEYSVNGNNYIQKYFYLCDKLFAFFDNDNNLYIVDISNENKIVRKIESFWDSNEFFIKDILYNEKEDKEENLYISFGNKRKKLVLKENRLTGEEREGKIIHVIIKKKKE